MKCDKCKNKPWNECCNDCKELDYNCYICKDIVKVKDYNKHLGEQYVNADQYLECNMCKTYKHMSFLMFRNGRCRLCICLNRYRYTHNRNQFRNMFLNIILRFDGALLLVFKISTSRDVSYKYQQNL